MNITTWRSEYQIGHKVIDAQHKYLFELANKTFEAKTKKEVAENLVLLNEHTREHFKDEESLMIEINYPGYLEHKQAHDDLLDKMYGFSEELNKGDMSNDDIKGFICLWLLDHILIKDEDLGRFIALSD
ncbi:MAG: bacteriohemerythrin [Methyloprofundus sp.]|nr:bacteriohemerythrin [Methyloprofundus sp.]